MQTTMYLRTQSNRNYTKWNFCVGGQLTQAGTALFLLVLTESLYTPEVRCRSDVESEEQHVPAAKSFVGKSMRTM